MTSKAKELISMCCGTLCNPRELIAEIEEMQGELDKKDQEIEALKLQVSILKRNLSRHDRFGLAEQPDPKADMVNKPPHNKYMREIKPGVWVDVYDVIQAWKVTNSAQQHLIKKALQGGQRGHKDYETDMHDIIASATRAIELDHAAQALGK